LYERFHILFSQEEETKNDNSTPITKQTSIKIFLAPSRPGPQKIIRDVFDNIMKEVFNVLFPTEKD